MPEATLPLLGGGKKRVCVSAGHCGEKEKPRWNWALPFVPAGADTPGPGGHHSPSASPASRSSPPFQPFQRLWSRFPFAFVPAAPGPLPPGVRGCAVSEPFAVPVPAAAAPAPPADYAVNKLW